MEKENRTVIRNAELVTVCGITSSLPEHLLPEVAFAGKSNVGKSSLLNALLNRKALARTSSQPGKTQTINFYEVNHALYLVDLPGYGYAKVSQQLREKWGAMIERYLKTSRQLRRVFLLIDIRHTPSANDRLMYEWVCSCGYEPVIVATKLDKISRGQTERQLKEIRQTLGTKPETRVLAFSAETKQGVEALWQLILEQLPEETKTAFLPAH